LDKTTLPLHKRCMMEQKTIELVKQFEKEHGMRVETHESHEHPVFWEVTVWMTKTADYQWMRGKKDIPRVWGRKYLTTPTAEGQVLVVRNPQKSNAFTAESWGPIGSYDEFVKKVLNQVKDNPLEKDCETFYEECGGAAPSG
jgi:hypothetical protein